MSLVPTRHLTLASLYLSPCSRSRCDHLFVAWQVLSAVLSITNTLHLNHGQAELDDTHCRVLCGEALLSHPCNISIPNCLHFIDAVLAGKLVEPATDLSQRHR